MHSLSPKIRWNLSFFSPVPCFEGVAGSLEEVPFHHHPVRGIHVELHLGVIVGEVLEKGNRLRPWQDTAEFLGLWWRWSNKTSKRDKSAKIPKFRAVSPRIIPIPANLFIPVFAGNCWPCYISLPWQLIRRKAESLSSGVLKIPNIWVRLGWEINPGVLFTG